MWGLLYALVPVGAAVVGWAVKVIFLDPVKALRDDIHALDEKVDKLVEHMATVASQGAVVAMRVNVIEDLVVAGRRRRAHPPE